MGIGEDIQNSVENAGHPIFKRLLLWIEKEAHLLGVDIEVEVASILAKLRTKQKK